MPASGLQDVHHSGFVLLNIVTHSTKIIPLYMRRKYFLSIVKIEALGRIPESRQGIGQSQKSMTSGFA